MFPFASRMSVVLLFSAVATYGDVLPEVRLARKGPEVRINSSPALDPTKVDAAATQGGGLIVVWDSLGADGDRRGILARRFAPGILPAESEFQVNSTTVLEQFSPKVAVSDDGQVLIAWTSHAPPRVAGQRFDASGARVGSELSITEPSFPFGLGPAVSGTGDGFVVAWTDFDDPGNYFLRARRIDRLGQLGAPFNVSVEESLFEQVGVSVAADTKDSFVVVWFEEASVEIRGRRFRGEEPIAPAFTIGQFGDSSRGTPTDVCTDATGGFVASWAGYYGPGAAHPVGYRRYDGAGNAITNPALAVPEVPARQQYEPAVSCLSNDHFVIVWNDLTFRRIRGRSYSASFPGDFFLRLSLGRVHGPGPSVVQMAGRDFFVIWTECWPGRCPEDPIKGCLPDECDLFGQRFTFGQGNCPGDCNLDGTVGVDEIITATLALLTSSQDSASACLPADTDLDAEISLQELLVAISRAQEGCIK